MYSYEHLSTIFVSQKFGNDSANGLSPVTDAYGNAPLRSIERALSIIRELRKAGVERPLTLSLVDDYYLTSQINISEKRLTVESFGKKKRIIGGIRIGGWKHGEYNGAACLCAAVPDGLDFTDLFVNGERARVTRYPKDGLLKIADCDDPKPTGDGIFDHSSTWFRLIPEDISKVGDLTGATANYFHYWIDEHSPIERHDTASGKIFMKYRSRFSVNTVYDGKDPSAIHCYLTNLGATFGERGEWYLDKRSSTVYYIPKDESITPESIEAFAPTLESLIHIEGEAVRLRNLELTCTNGEYSSRLLYENETAKYPERPLLFASDIQSVCGAPGAISFENASRCSLCDCCVHGVGIYAIEIKKSCDHIRIERNHIYDICAGGIKVEGGSESEDASLATTDCIISKNHIHSIGKRYMAGCGILVMHARDCVIEENEIHDTEYSGISVGWVWGYGDSTTYGTVIRGNHIYDIGKGNLSDMGGIYLLGKQSGAVVSENRIHDVRFLTYGAQGIYLDEGSSFITVERNVVYDTESESFHLHYGSHNTVKNNIFYSRNAPCIAVSKVEEHYQVDFEQNILITENRPIFKGRLQNLPLNFGKNLIWDTSRPVPMARIDKFGEISEMNLSENGNTVADPKLTDLSNFDFTLTPDSPVFALGFSPLPENIAKK